MTVAITATALVIGPMAKEPLIIDLSTTYLGLSLSSPVVASASPLTGRLDDLMALEASGAGAVVLPSLFEEQLTEDALHIDRLIESGPGTSEAPSGWFPPLGDYNTGADGYLSLVERAR